MPDQAPEQALAQSGRRRRLVVIGVSAAALAGAVTALALLGGGADPDGATGGAASPSPATTATSADAPVLPPAVPTQTPAPTAGDLNGDDLPAAAALGPGWATQALVDDAEEGIVGNGTPYQQRDPAGAVSLLLPLGCEQRSALPQPEAALEASYHHQDGVPAVALRLRMADAAEADRLVTVLAGDLRACRDQPADPATGVGPPVASVGRAGDAVTSRRVDPVEHDPALLWSEIVLPAGADVLVVAVNLAADDPRYVGPGRLADALGDLAG